jgi:nitrous oxidase accessory protein
MVASAVSGGEAIARTYIVSPDGSSISSISKAIRIADKGDSIVVKGGVYRERIVVDKPLKIIGIDKPIIDGERKGTVVFINAPNCTFKGFVIKGSGSSLTTEDAGILLDSAEEGVIEDNQLEDVLFGIYLKNSPRGLIRNNFIIGKSLDMPNRGDGIRLWYSSETRIENNYVTQTRDLVIWFSSKTLIKGNKVEKGRYGLHYMYSNDNVFENNVFTENFVGGFLMYSRGIRFYHNIFAHNQGLASGYGIGFKDLDDVVAEENLFIDNRIGLYLDNSPHLIDSWNNIRKNVIAFNDIGASLMPSIERNVFSENSFIENTEQVEVRGGGTLSGNKWYENKRGNHWSDYVGYDENRDGIGEIPYLAESLFESIIDKHPNLRIFIFSPVSQAIEFASHAFPVIKPEPKVIDEYPIIDARIPDRFKTKEKRLSLGFLTASIFLVLIPFVFYAHLAMPINRDSYDRNKRGN